MSDRLNATELRSTYGAEIREMEANAANEAAKPLNEKITELETNVSEQAAELVKKDEEIKTLTEAGEKATAEIAEMKKANLEETKKRHELELAKFVSDEIAEMKVSEKISEMLVERVSPTLVEDDDAELTQSKAETKKSLDAEFGHIKQVSEMTGGSLLGKSEADKKKAGGNPPRKQDQTESKGLEGFIMVGADKSSDKSE